MYPTHSISACLISSRNMLFNHGPIENVLTCLEEVIANVASISVPPVRKIVAYCVSAAIKNIENSDSVGAGRILNLIHNLPLEEVIEKQWDIDYFFSVELPEFLEHYSEVLSAKEVVLYIFQQIAIMRLERN